MLFVFIEAEYRSLLRGDFGPYLLGIRVHSKQPRLQNGQLQYGTD